MAAMAAISNCRRLLAETAAQSDIAYLLVVRTDGVIIAHSQRDKVGSRYGSDLDLPAIHASATLRSRQGVSADGSGAFEVFGRFAPLARPPVWMRRGHRMGRGEMMTDPPSPPEMVIFVGLRTDSVDAARAADTRHTIVMAAVLLLAGCAGVLLLLLAQNYRSARTSLIRVQAFSDNLVTRMPIGLVALDRDSRVTAVNSGGPGNAGAGCGRGDRPARGQGDSGGIAEAPRTMPTSRCNGKWSVRWPTAGGFPWT